MSDTVEVGGRNEAIRKFVASMLKHAKDPEASDALLWREALAWNRRYNDPPLPEEEVRKLFEGLLTAELVRRKPTAVLIGKDSPATMAREFWKTPPTDAELAKFLADADAGTEWAIVPPESRMVIEELVKLRAFKAYVHGTLDAFNVRKQFPDGPHTKEGCRIGDRLASVLNELTESREECSRHAEKWRTYEREYILPCFDQAKLAGIDLHQLVRAKPGTNCVSLLVELLTEQRNELAKLVRLLSDELEGAAASKATHAEVDRICSYPKGVQGQ